MRIPQYAAQALKKALVFVTGPPGPRKTRPLGRVILRFPAPVPGPARSPDGSPLKQVGRNGAPSRE